MARNGEVRISQEDRGLLENYHALVQVAVGNLAAAIPAEPEMPTPSYIQQGIQTAETFANSDPYAQPGIQSAEMFANGVDQTAPVPTNIYAKAGGIASAPEVNY